MQYPVTPDGRYFVVRGRLWRCSDPSLDAGAKAALTRDLMSARRAKLAAMRTSDDPAREAARQRVDAAKVALGERGPVWWADGAPDWNRKLARMTPYAAWYAEMAAAGPRLAPTTNPLPSSPASGTSPAPAGTTE